MLSGLISHLLSSLLNTPLFSLLMAQIKFPHYAAFYSIAYHHDFRMTWFRIFPLVLGCHYDNEEAGGGKNDFVKLICMSILSLCEQHRHNRWYNGESRGLLRRGKSIRFLSAPSATREGLKALERRKFEYFFASTCRVCKLA